MRIKSCGVAKGRAERRKVEKKKNGGRDGGKKTKRTRESRENVTRGDAHSVLQWEKRRERERRI